MKLREFDVRIWCRYDEDYTDMVIKAQSEKAAIALALKDAKRNASTLFDGPGMPSFDAEVIE